MKYSIFGLFLFISPFVYSATIDITVIDGDTIRYGDGIKGRLAYIDAPELHQPFGVESKNALIRYLNTNDVIVTELPGHDIYSRKLVILINKQTKEDVNSLLVRYGYAWDYSRKYLSEQSIAQSNKSGLWASTTAPINPRLWRDMYRYPGLFIADTSIDEKCNASRMKYCSEFKTCEEATFWFKTCGHYYLDRDNNDIPCETLCK